jgi:hypothetical protein
MAVTYRGCSQSVTEHRSLFNPASKLTIQMENKGIRAELRFANAGVGLLPALQILSS